MSSINLVNNSILATTRRENNKADNCILSNEDFSDRPFITQCKSSYPRRDNILQKQASFIQNSRNDNLKSLKHQPSKLDLIDDTKLTSLPLPPPPKMRSSVASYPGKDTEHSIRCSESVSTYNTDDEYDEGIEESEDPIILVEDYMTSETNVNTDEQKHINKRDSLAVFKDRIYQNEDRSSLSTISATSTIISKLTNPKTPFETRCTSNETLSKTKITRKEQDLEEIFGKIPGSDSLKYCDLCEKPLYEISSLIDNKIDSTLEHTTNETPSCKENARLYSEFVCWECVETYEEFFNELCANESDHCKSDFKETIDKNNATGSIRLFEIFHGINQKYNIQNSSGQSELHFSSYLIQKLSKLNSSADSIPMGAHSRSETFDWVKYLQYQLRWRWRIAGLIPNAFKSDSDQS
ncbi:DEHA2G09020p [Debaryomyces hansenii CBS767]|uniref:DEHA2G09020p n=1 Tax=Debaryomyces hansenii (strain ATCC 36239 / CBS 767 / BCRC 21394 / JCM 1990 / NBRC 0083 / IGC 2968) TaxID=284592 RepID=Q6BIN2_DEBHA|nr:DEHA2G09020p [Debaryomyces hansenii CBS767]CAG90407.2 DEHA2G09020p [Debaryomyces hansenii CBS767]|eukprot:XP_461939.2 DEHA2G09020p [Debaryomyces hansenii CBS767]